MRVADEDDESTDRNNARKGEKPDNKSKKVSDDKVSSENEIEKRKELQKEKNKGLSKDEVEVKGKEIHYEASRKIGLQPVVPYHINKYLSKGYNRDLNTDKNEAGREAAAYEFLDNELKFFKKL